MTTDTNRAAVDQLRAELRDARNDLLDVRGLLSPNGHDPVTPVPLVPTVAPAVAWLVDELANVRTELAAMTDRALACATLAGSLRDELDSTQAAGHDQAGEQQRGPDDELGTELAAVDAQMARVDTKASVLLGLAGAATTVALGALTGLAGAAFVLALLAVAAFAAATVLLVFAVRPALSSRAPYGFVAYATRDRAGLVAALTGSAEPDRRLDRLAAASRSVLRKYRRVRVAVDLLMVGLVLAVAASAWMWS
jgi:hypothetical protein